MIKKQNTRLIKDKNIKTDQQIKEFLKSINIGIY